MPKLKKGALSIYDASENFIYLGRPNLDVGNANNWPSFHCREFAVIALPAGIPDLKTKLPDPFVICDPSGSSKGIHTESGAW